MAHGRITGLDLEGTSTLALDFQQAIMTNGHPPGRRAARELGRDEIERFLEQHHWGVLATSLDDQPYAVPIVYGWDGESLYFACSPGKKADILRINPRVCLTVPDVRDPSRGWTSVVALGRVEWIDSVAGKLSAFNILRKQMPTAVPRLSDAARLARANVARIVIDELTGRSVGDDESPGL